MRCSEPGQHAPVAIAALAAAELGSLVAMNASPMKVFADIAGELRLTRGSRWTWLCSISPLLSCGAILLAKLLIMCGLRNSPLMLIPLFATLLFALFAVFLAVPVWCVLLLFKKLRLPWQTHRMQAYVFVLGWIVTLLVSRLMKPLPLPNWLD
jgi:hypothetical protein